MCVLGFIWAEIKEMWDGGFTEYIHDCWNLMDFAMNSLYLATISLKIVAYVKVMMAANPAPMQRWVRTATSSHPQSNNVRVPSKRRLRSADAFMQLISVYFSILS